MKHRKVCKSSLFFFLAILCLLFSRVCQMGLFDRSDGRLLFVISFVDLSIAMPMFCTLFSAGMVSGIREISGRQLPQRMVRVFRIASMVLALLYIVLLIVSFAQGTLYVRIRLFSLSAWSFSAWGVLFALGAKRGRD